MRQGERTDVIASASTPEDVRFIVEYQRHLDGPIQIFCTNFVTWIYGRRLGAACFPPPKRVRGAGAPAFDGVEHSFSAASGRLSPEEAKAAAVAAYHQLLPVAQSARYALIPSGRHAQQIGMTRFCRDHTIPTLFFGYGNIKGLTVVDPWGTDAESAFFENPKAVMASLAGEPASSDDVLERTKAAIKARPRPLQARSKYYPYYRDLVFVLDYLAQSLTGRISDRRPSRAANAPPAYEVGGGGAAVRLYDTRLDDPSDYLFFPLQVSTDVQVMMNYHGGSLEAAIAEVDDLAFRTGRKVCFKRHPVEPTGDIVNRVARRAEWEEWTSSVPDSFDHFQDYVVVNSTVGLQALIFGKGVTFLGKSLFKHLGKDVSVADYLGSYLMDFDFQEPATLSADTVKRMENRAAAWSRAGLYRLG